MKTTITLTREDGAEISFSLPSVSQSFTLSFPRGMAFNDAARDVVRQSMKTEAERVAALFNGAPAALSALKRLSIVCAINNAETLRAFYPSAGYEDLLQLARDSEPMKAASAAIALAEGRAS